MKKIVRGISNWIDSLIAPMFMPWDWWKTKKHQERNADHQAYHDRVVNRI